MILSKLSKMGSCALIVCGLSTISAKEVNRASAFVFLCCTWCCRCNDNGKKDNCKLFHVKIDSLSSIGFFACFYELRRQLKCEHSTNVAKKSYIANLLP